MANGTFVSYLRVSTDRQGKSGLGLEAQRKAVTDFLNGGAWTVVSEFLEIESGSRDDRPQLAAALRACRVHNATLVIAKLDRLSRDVHFLTGLQRAGIRFLAADMPEANEMVVQMMAVVAQAERKLISTRTKAALAAAKARGVKLGGLRRRISDGNAVTISAEARAAGIAVRVARSIDRAADIASVIDDIKANGALSLREIAARLNALRVPAARGGEWSAVQVQRVLTRLNKTA